MGFNERGESISYAHVSKGKLITGKADNKKEFGSYTGILRKIENFEDEYEGKKIWKVKLLFEEPADNSKTQISFSEESFFAVGFYARLYNVDLSKEFTLGVIQSDQNEKVSFCYLKQGDKKIEKHPDAVGPEKVTTKIRGVDKTEYAWQKALDFFSTVNLWATERIEHFKTHDPDIRGNSETKEEAPAVTSAADDDLPF